MLVIAAAVVWLHWPGGAVFKCDDYAAIPYAMDWRNCAADFVGSQYGLHVTEFYRPFITLSFGLNLWLGGTEPFGYYLTSTLALLASALLLHAIVAMVTQSRPLAFAASVLWVCHPIVVVSQRCWAAGRVDTHLAVPLLLALFLHLRTRRGGPRWPVWLAALWGLGTKESAVCFPILALSLDLLDPVENRRPGRPPPAWPYLVLIPAYFAWRLVVLGDWLGGYSWTRHAAIDAPATLLAALHVFGRTLVPGAAGTLPVVITGALAAALSWRCAVHPGRRLRRACGVLLMTGGLFFPLAQMLPAMVEGDQRWAYVICAWAPLLWTVLVADLCGGARGGWRCLPLLLLPLAWLLPARTAERAAMDQHDRFVTSVVGAMRECDALLPPGDPVVVAGDCDLCLHSYRLNWGLGAVLRQPWQRAERAAVRLGHLLGYTVAATDDLVCEHMPAWVAIDQNGGRVVTGAHAPHDRVAPLGFDGVLNAELVDRLLWDPEPGYPVGPEFDGRVAVCTTLGSLMARVQARNGMFALRDVFGTDISTQAGSPVALWTYLWWPADADPKCPMFLFWREGDRRCMSELIVGEGYVTRFLEHMDAAKRASSPR